MNKVINTVGMACIAGLLFFSSCKKDVAGEENDEEVITTLQLAFTPNSGGTPLIYKFEDADGPGGLAPVTDDIILEPETNYSVTLKLLNITTEPVTDITKEVMDESAAHRFYYNATAGSNLTISDLDIDENGLPLGVNSVWKTGETANGNVTVVLRHYPGFPPDKASDDPMDSPKSSTDVMVTFNTIVE